MFSVWSKLLALTWFLTLLACKMGLGVRSVLILCRIKGSSLPLAAHLHRLLVAIMTTFYQEGQNHTVNRGQDRARTWAHSFESRFGSKEELGED